MKLGFLFATTFAVALTGCTTVSNKQSPEAPIGTNAAHETLKQQIFLDSNNFGPGLVDGRLGEFTRKAMVNYRAAMGLPADWVPDTRGIPSHSTYTISAKDVSTPAENASETEDQAKQSKMPYTSLIELLAERFHTTKEFLYALNPGININSASPGTMITVPAIARPFRYHDYPSSYSAPSYATAGNRHVTVDLHGKILSVHENGRTIAAFPITPGSAQHPAPVGEWRIVGSVPFPWYRYDLGVLKRGERTEDYYNLPPGPNNPVGILWAGLNRPGIGIHGSPVPQTIGRTGSHGCIRLSNWDAATFYTLVGEGTKVTIQ